MEKKSSFTRYETFVVAILTILQFSIILDFMVMSPLGAILMPELTITPTQFGLVVSAYAFSAGASGLLAAGFADRYDRKKMLLFFYVGFIFGTLLCGIATNYEFLLAARIVTGLFGGVIGSISFAIITDIFKIEVRGLVMGFVQMAFASSQVLGLPLGLYMANHWGWHSPFLLIVVLSIGVAVVIGLYLNPIDAHLKEKSDRNAFYHLFKTLTKSEYVKAFGATMLLATGGFMLMPFGSAFSVNNLKISLDQLPALYMVTGAFSMAASPLIGRFSDTWGKYRTFFTGSAVTIVVVIIFCYLEATPLWLVMVINVIMFTGVSSRMISSSALISGIPAMHDRGAFMSINSSIQQISGGIASFVAGLLVYQAPDGHLENYPLIGYVVSGATIITMIMMYWVDRQVRGAQNSRPIAS